MCNAHNHDPWCPCGWGPVHEYFGDMGEEAICRIFSPFNSGLKQIYKIAGEPLKDFITAYKNMGAICDAANKWKDSSDKLKGTLKKALKDTDKNMNEYEKQLAALTQQLEKAKSKEEKDQISKQISSLDASMNKQIKSKGFTYIDKKGKKNEVNSPADYKNHLKEIKSTGLNKYYSGVGKCDGFVRDKILHDIVGVDLKASGSDVVGVKDLFDYSKKNKIDAPMNEEVYTYRANNDKAGFKTALAKFIFPGSLLFRDGSGSGQLHTGVVVKVSVKDGGLDSIVLVHTGHSDVETGGIKSWTIRADELWKSAEVYDRKEKGKVVESYRRLFISNITMHRRLEQVNKP